MTPIFIQMACRFCWEPLEIVIQLHNRTAFDVYLCRNCQPPHKTLYRQLYVNGKTDLLSDHIQLDNWYVTRYFRPNSLGDYNYSIVYKDALGTLDSIPDMEPLSLKGSVCRINQIIELPLDDIEAAKRKLTLYTTFS